MIKSKLQINIRISRNSWTVLDSGKEIVVEFAITADRSQF